MKEIKLSQGKVAIVDDEDYELVSQYKWYANFNKYTQTYYAKHNYFLSGKYKYLHMHRLILGCSEGDKLIVHHKDHDSLNNTKENLKICSVQENCRHQYKLKTKKTSSKYKGVYWKKSLNKWVSQIRIGDKRKHLGCFTSEIEAAKAYNDAALKHFAEFALINKI